MSNNMISVGYFGMLKHPIPPGTVEDLTAEGHLPDGWQFNYEGTLIFSDSRSEAAEVNKLIFAGRAANIFRKDCASMGHEVEEVKFYVSHWHDGCDSPMATAKVKDVFK